jgi:hypothetical protein
MFLSNNYRCINLFFHSWIKSCKIRVVVVDNTSASLLLVIMERSRGGRYLSLGVDLDYWDLRERRQTFLLWDRGNSVALRKGTVVRKTDVAMTQQSLERIGRLG